MNKIEHENGKVEMKHSGKVNLGEGIRRLQAAVDSRIGALAEPDAERAVELISELRSIWLRTAAPERGVVFRPDGTVLRRDMTSRERTARARIARREAAAAVPAVSMAQLDDDVPMGGGFIAKPNEEPNKEQKAKWSGPLPRMPDADPTGGIAALRRGLSEAYAERRAEQDKPARAPVKGVLFQSTDDDAPAAPAAHVVDGFTKAEGNMLEQAQKEAVAKATKGKGKKGKAATA